MRIEFDYFRVGILGEGRDKLHVNSVFEIRFPGSETVQVDPEKDVALVARQLLEHVMGREVQTFVWADRESLVVDIEGGTRIVVPPDPDYEAWEVSGPDGAKLACMPRGEIAIWDPRV